jgi:L-seryl-tRNA(Ser) seleniumtransferase
MEVMKKASKEFVIMTELQDIAGEIIAKVTGAEAAMVTAGATSSLQLGAAACLLKGSGLENHSIKPYERLQPIDGPWKEIIQRIPDEQRLKVEFISQKSHKSPYDFAFKMVGGKRKYVGSINECSKEELLAGISYKTAAVVFSAHRETLGLTLEKTIEIAHSNHVPVIVDAAIAVLPRRKLNRYASLGADLVAISGGKQIKGPNDTGILCGSKELVEMAKLQFSPFNGLGRGMKVDRTQIVGLLKALEIFLEKSSEEEEAEFIDWIRVAEWIATHIQGVNGVSSVSVSSEIPWEVRAMITFDDRISARELAFDLRRGDPSIWVETSMTGDTSLNQIGIATDSLGKDEEKILVSALKEYLHMKNKDSE